MSTNYYARLNACKTCGHSNNEIHIGHLSIGWTFNFHSTDEIKSYKQWLKYLSRKDIRIFDECDNEITLDKFKSIVESAKSATNNYAKEVHGVDLDDHSYLDDEGNSMSPHEFS